MSIIIFFLFAAVTKADIAPAAGYTQVRTDLIIETTEDLSDFRFFLDFRGDCNEVKLKSNDITTIPSPGGGVRYSTGTLLAIPKKSLKDFGEELTFEQQHQLGELVSKNQVDQMLKLLQHSFSTIINDSDIANWSYPTYRLERNGNTFVAKENQRIKPRKSSGAAIDFTFYGIVKRITIFGYIVFIGIPLILTVLGIWLFRKRKLGKKL